MATETQSAPSAAAAPAVALPVVFAYRASKGPSTIMHLTAFDLDGRQMRVDAEISSIQAAKRGEPQRLSYTFPSREQAQRFADDAVISFEYMGCHIEVLA
jgi:hypothetical protein